MDVDGIELFQDEQKIIVAEEVDKEDIDEGGDVFEVDQKKQPGLKAMLKTNFQNDFLDDLEDALEEVYEPPVQDDEELDRLDDTVITEEADKS